MSEAHCIQAGIESLVFQQLLVRPLLNNLPRLNDHNIVGIFDRRKTVRDHERGTTRQQAFQTLLHDCLGEGVDVGRGLVQDQDTRVRQ